LERNGKKGEKKSKSETPSFIISTREGKKSELRGKRRKEKKRKEGTGSVPSFGPQGEAKKKPGP